MKIIRINAMWCPGCLISKGIWKEIENLSDSIAKGYVKLEDVQQSLKDEDGIDLTR